MHNKYKVITPLLSVITGPYFSFVKERFYMTVPVDFLNSHRMAIQLKPIQFYRFMH